MLYHVPSTGSPVAASIARKSTASLTRMTSTEGEILNSTGSGVGGGVSAAQPARATAAMRRNSVFLMMESLSADG